MTTTTLDDIRALVGIFRRSGLRDLSVRTDDWTIFAAKTGGGVNPLMAPSIGSMPDTMTATAQIEAPHAGIFRPGCDPGTRVVAGQIVCWVSVLGDDRPVLSATSGAVEIFLQPDGAFVEMGSPLVRQSVDR